MVNVNDRLLSTEQFAAQTPFSGESIRRRCREGSIVGARRCGRLWLIPESSLRLLGTAASQPIPEVRRLPDDPMERERFWQECDRELQRRPHGSAQR